MLQQLRLRSPSKGARLRKQRSSRCVAGHASKKGTQAMAWELQCMQADTD